MNLTGQTMTATAGRARGAWAANVPPRPARSPREHKAMLDELMRLGRKMDAGTATRAEADAVQVLTLLTGEYETARYGEIKDRSTPVDRLRFLLDENDMSASDLGRLLGDRPLGTRVLNGERALSKAHVRRLAEHFKLSPAYFL